MSSTSRISSLAAFYLIASYLPHPSLSFILPPRTTTRPINKHFHPFSSSSNNNNGDDDVSRQLLKAKELLAKTKAKINTKNKDNSSTKTDKQQSSSSTPYFAATTTDRSSVIKSRDPSSGLITTDGQKMAELSEEEEWEARSLMDVFEREDGEVSLSRQEAMEKMDKDTTRAMWGLKKSLRDVDFDIVFDKRNRFIGETD